MKRTKKHLFKVTFIFGLFMTATLAIFAQRVEKTISLRDFSSLSLVMNGDVLITPGNRNSITIEADESDIDHIDIAIKGDKLQITKKGQHIKIKNPKFFVTVKHLDEIKLVGSGNINCRKQLSADKFNVILSGSGNIDLKDINSQDMKIILSGSGNIFLGGKQQVHDAEILLSGSGNIISHELAMQNVKVSLSGSGNCKVNSENHLKAAVTGSGNILYTGNAIINSRVTGSGKVRRM